VCVVRLRGTEERQERPFRFEQTRELVGQGLRPGPLKISEVSAGRCYVSAAGSFGTLVCAPFAQAMMQAFDWRMALLGCGTGSSCLARIIWQGPARHGASNSLAESKRCCAQNYFMTDNGGPITGGCAW